MKVIFLNTSFSGKRLDKTVNDRSRLLNECMRENGFIRLNGRSQFDTSGEYTFFNDTGKSVIDMCWINSNSLGLIENFKVHPNIYSEHAIITITSPKKAEMSSSMKTQQLEKHSSQRLRWNSEKLYAYTLSIKQLPHIYFNSNSPDLLFVNPQEAILIVAGISNMLSTTFPKRFSNKLDNKPWYNPECKILKDNLKIE